ncbi:MAG: SMC family ATPase [Chloroflexi bacterium]|nr:SMC family ATPase [Chloroflexota bacterium]
MIPIRLEISGFLSYCEPASLDFEAFNLACISGPNGSGKSSLLDAITWVLFGEARGKSSEVINLNKEVKAAEVALTFRYEENLYRIQRTLPRTKNTILEFQIHDGQVWKPLTERTTRETQGRIEQILRLDHETFINASFFLQGKADLFTQKKASERKAILSNILGLDSWEVYKERSAEKRKAIEREVDEIQGRISEIHAELEEEQTRKERVTELETRLKLLTSSRASQELALENIRRLSASMEEQRSLVITLESSLTRANTALLGLEGRLTTKEGDLASTAELIRRSDEIEARYKDWQMTQKELRNWEEIASKFRDYEQDRLPLLEKITTEKARLEEEKRLLQIQEQSVVERRAAFDNLQESLDRATLLLKQAEERVAERRELEKKWSSDRERQAEIKSENETLHAEMNQLKDRIDALESATDASCPLCGQELTEKHRRSTLRLLKGEGKEKGDRYRANQKAMNDLAGHISEYEQTIKSLLPFEGEQLRYTTELSQLSERKQTLLDQTKEWESGGSKRLTELDKQLEGKKYAPQEYKRLAQLDKHLAKLGYDAARHDEIRDREASLRDSGEEFMSLQSLKEANRQMQGEIKTLRIEIDNRRGDIAHLNSELKTAKNKLQSAEAETPNALEAEQELLRMREEENRLLGELGGARQRVEILNTQRARKEDFERTREQLERQIVRYRTLERAFGRDGVPALLIEQALPQIETKANDLLDRLSDGQMSIRFITQAEYKDKKREDLKETLDILIHDSAGTRDYEMFSGGEAFRVNFAIRLALSEILAQRKGARLQTLVIDEGFGSQDSQGRQRLIEAINLIRHDFAKILVITHLDELKDAFPNRIEVEKTDRGSKIRVL